MQEINDRVNEIGFDNCKVFVHSLDSQSSANGGILVQVVGEMSNRNNPWRKFAQTFFLAQQQSGYFVLNDIFRFLRDDDEVDEDLNNDQNVEVNGVDQSQPKVETPNPIEVASPAPSVPQATAINDTSEIKKSQNDEQPSQDSQQQTQPQKPEATTSKSPIQQNSQPASQQSPVPSQPSPQKSSAPKTWANLAAANSKKWGQVAQDNKQQQVPIQSPKPSNADTKPTQAQLAVQSVSHSLCFVKNVTEAINGEQLRVILERKFGLIRDVDVVRSKACAFVQFEKIDSAKKAIIASHNPSQGGEGGIKIGNHTVQIESRREKPKNQQNKNQQKNNKGNRQNSGRNRQSNKQQQQQQQQN